MKRQLALVVAGLVAVLMLAGQLARATAGPEPNDPQDSLPAFASDGVYVAFQRDVPDGPNVLSMTSAGKDLSVDSSGATLRGYVPGTTHLVIQISDHDSQVITGSRYDPPVALLRGTDATASPDGRRVAYLRGGTLYVAGIDGSGERAIASAIAPPSWDVVGPAWSPDATRIAIASNSSLLVVNTDGSGSKVIWDGPNQNVNPSWSADGLQVAWETNADAHWEIWVWVDCNRCGPRVLLSSPTANYRLPQFSPVSSNTFAFISDRQHAKGGATRYQFALYTEQLSSPVLHKLVDDVHPTHRRAGLRRGRSLPSPQARSAAGGGSTSRGRMWARSLIAARTSAVSTERPLRTPSRGPRTSTSSTGSAVTTYSTATVGTTRSRATTATM